MVHGSRVTAVCALVAAVASGTIAPARSARLCECVQLAAPSEAIRRETP